MGCGRLGFGSRRVGERDELHVGFGGDVEAEGLRQLVALPQLSTHDMPSWYFSVVAARRGHWAFFNPVFGTSGKLAMRNPSATAAHDRDGS
jgi:hypothetical protein